MAVLNQWHNHVWTEVDQSWSGSDDFARAGLSAIYNLIGALSEFWALCSIWLVGWAGHPGEVSQTSFWHPELLRSAGRRETIRYLVGKVALNHKTVYRIYSDMQWYASLFHLSRLRVTCICMKLNVGSLKDVCMFKYRWY